MHIDAQTVGIRYRLHNEVDYTQQDLPGDELVRQELHEVHLQLEEGQIGEEEFAEREAVLFARLREIREYRKEQARQGLEASVPTEADGRTFVIEIPEELE